MATVSQDITVKYFKVTDTDQLADGTFNINLKEVKNYLGEPVDIQMPPIPAQRRTVNRNNDVPVGTIVRVTETLTLDRVFSVNPSS